MVIKMAFIKEEREDLKIEEDFKHEDTEEQQTEIMYIIEESGDVMIEGITEQQSEMMFIIEESGDVMIVENTEQQKEMMYIIEETIEVKKEDTEEQTEMIIKEESEDVKNEVKQEDTEEQTGQFHQSFCVMNLFISHIK